MFCASLLSCLEGKTASKEKTKSMFMMKGIWREGNLFFHLILSSPFIPDKNADPKRCMPHVESPYFCSLSCIRIDKKEKNRMWITSPFKSILVKEQFLEVSDRRRKERVLSLLLSFYLFFHLIHSFSFFSFEFLTKSTKMRERKWNSSFFFILFSSLRLHFHSRLSSQASITSFYHKLPSQGFQLKAFITEHLLHSSFQTKSSTFALRPDFIFVQFSSCVYFFL